MKRIKLLLSFLLLFTVINIDSASIVKSEDALLYGSYFVNNSVTSSDDIQFIQSQIISSSDADATLATDPTSFDTFITNTDTNWNNQTAFDKNYSIGEAELAQKGLVRVDLDMKGADLESSADIVFVMDVSGSMALGTQNTSAASGFYNHGIHCLNDDHYYKIAAQYTNDNQDLYVSVKDIKEIFGYQTYNNWTADAKAVFIDRFNLVSNFSTQAYNFGDNHYHKEGEEYLKIGPLPVEGSTTTGTAVWYAVTDSINATTECIDRMFIMQDSVGKFIANTKANSLTANTNFGLIVFAGQTKLSSNFADSTDTTALLNRVDTFTQNGYNGTNYTSGIKRAYQIFNEAGAVETNQKHVIFISDGAPYVKNADDYANPTYNGLSPERQAMINAGVQIHTVGIMIDSANLSNLASSANNYYKNINNAEEFNSALEEIAKSIFDNPTVDVEDKIPAELELVISEDVPVYLDLNGSGKIRYTSIAQLQSAGISVVVDENDVTTITFSNKLGSKGARLTYYVKERKLNEGDPDIVNVIDVPLTIVTTKILTQEEITNGDNAETSTTVTDDSGNKLVFNSSLVSIIKAQELIKNSNNTIQGKAEINDEIKYTFTITKAGNLNNVKFTLKDTSPESTSTTANLNEVIEMTSNDPISKYFTV